MERRSWFILRYSLVVGKLSVISILSILTIVSSDPWTALNCIWMGNKQQRERERERGEGERKGYLKKKILIMIFIDIPKIKF